MGPAGKDLEPVISDSHWDFVVMRSAIALDCKVICEKDIVRDFEG
jgi:hypothetical protein